MALRHWGFRFMVNRLRAPTQKYSSIQLVTCTIQFLRQTKRKTADDFDRTRGSSYEDDQMLSTAPELRYVIRETYSAAKSYILFLFVFCFVLFFLFLFLSFFLFFYCEKKMWHFPLE